MASINFINIKKLTKTNQKSLNVMLNTKTHLAISLHYYIEMHIKQALEDDFVQLGKHNVWRLMRQIRLKWSITADT